MAITKKKKPAPDDYRQPARLAGCEVDGVLSSIQRTGILRREEERREKGEKQDSRATAAQPEGPKGRGTGGGRRNVEADE